MNVQGVEVWSDILRSIFHFFDGIVFFLIKPVLQGIFDLSSLNTSSSLLNGVYSRIYVIVGIFMAFKLGFTFFQYIIDPDSLTEGKDKSIGKLLTNTIIMLAALILLPTILFSSNGSESMLSRAERAFLPMVPRIILGTDVNTSSESLSEAGDTMATTIMRAFFSKSENLSDYCNINSKSYPEIQSLDDVGSYLNIKCNAKNSSGGYSKYYVYTYNAIPSTIVGGLLVVMFLGITINVAKRIFKLIILEVLAPIPIMTLIDPKSASSGTFSKWLSSLVSTFLDVFIQFGVVYLAIYFIQIIVNKGLFSNMSSITGFRGAYITVALIIGVIYFAKEAPKFIQDALGLKSTGSVGGIFKNVGGILALGSKAAGIGTAALGVPGSIISSERASYDSDEANDKKHNVFRRAKNIGAGILGGISGGATGVKAAVGKNGGVRTVMEAQQARNQRVRSMGGAGSTWSGRRISGLQNLIFGDTTATKMGRRIEEIESRKGVLEAIAKRASGEMIKSTDTWGNFGSNSSVAGYEFNYKSAMASYEAARSAGASSVTLKDRMGNSHTIGMDEFELNKGALQTSNEDFYIKHARDGSDGLSVDNVLKQYVDYADKMSYIDSNGKDIASNTNGRKPIKSQIETMDIYLYDQKKKQKMAAANDKYSAKKK